LYLKSLELQGFKSFPDKTVFTFDENITAIVGPNGSGKSNIADAICWVLGEQSSRALRGTRMEDIIFGGTKSRSPVGYAEVSLILDNSARVFPVDGNEVMITRRYYRSGESEYYINKASVRLKDINELFMDTGLGRDGYSIIGQGRIDEILSAKSGDRRDIFEEAAGISKFRYRKTEAERKLESTETNLLRINDKISELELNLEPVRQQAEKARRYLVCRDEIRLLEVMLWLDQLEKLRASSAKTRENFETTSRQLERENAALEAIYARAEELSERMRTLELETETSRQKLSVCEAELRECESGAELKHAAAASLSENAERLRAELEQQAGREGGLAARIAETKKRITELEAEAEAGAKALDEIEKNLMALSNAEAEQRSKLGALEAEAASGESELARSRVLLSSLNATASEIEARSAAIEKERAERAALRESAEAELRAKTKEIEALREQASAADNAVKGYELLLQNKRKRFEAAKEARTKALMAQSSAESRAKLLEDMEKSYEGFNSAVKLVMRESEHGMLDGIHGPLSSLIKVDDAGTLAVETALGQALQNIVTNTPKDAQAAIELLKQRNGGRATFLPISRIEGRTLSERLEGEQGFVGLASDLVHCANDYRQIVLNLLGRTAVTETLSDAVRIAGKTSNRFRIVTLDGQIINAGGSMTGGSSVKSAGVLSRANELERLHAELAEMKKNNAGADAALREQEREITAADYQCSVARTEMRTAEDAIIKAEGELSLIKNRIDSFEAAERNTAEEQKALKNRGSENAAAAERLAADASSAEERLKAVNERKNALMMSLSELEDKRRALSDEAALLRERRQGGLSEKNALAESAASLEALSLQFSSDRTRIGDMIESSEKEKLANEQAAEAFRLKADALRAECEKYRAEIKKLGETKLSIEAKRAAGDREGQEKNKTILNLERERGRLEQLKTEADMNERQIVEKLWDSYELTRSTAAQLPKPDISIAAAQKRVSELRREIAKLGDVNVGAIEECDRLTERYDYLTSQREDVETAKRELLEIIGDITLKMEKVFADQFRLINERFTETFTELFGGGTASLELEDPKDILNCGIEIRVQPPGKTIKTLTLLSGGEKAFVAIALYFAIIKVRPTPFCVMDEIEAALDDVNVRRVAAYMRKLCGGTQFIVITHRRGTMEGSDLLYGVTMQASGVSRVLALNINEAEEKLGLKIH